MGRARRSAFSLLLVVLALGGATVTFSPRPLDPERSAAVAWPVSSLVVSEVMTGGVSASDEFIELANAGTDPVDLAGLEVVYATATGSTVTRKASWAGSTSVAAGHHLLIANSAGSFAPIADATYSGGLASTGGAVALRVIGGAVVDAVAWGDATNAFVEAAAAPAPPARSSIERLPGADEGNGTDTNDNAGDWFIQASPSPQDLASAPTSAGASASPASSAPLASPVPDPSVTPQPTGTPTPIASPTTGTPSPPASPTLDPSSEPPSEAPPSASPPLDGSPSPGPTGSPDPGTPEPTGASSPTPGPTASPTSPVSLTPAPSSPNPSVSPVSVIDARALPDDTTVTIEGILTTDLGALEAGRTGFVQDATGGIAVYLDAPAVAGPGAGTRVRITGTVDDRFGQRTLRTAASAILAVGPDALPAAVTSQTGAVAEGIEGSRVAISGLVTEAPTSLADGLGLMVDDGSGPVRVVVSPAAQIAAAVARGSSVAVVGPVGQHDSSGSGSSGYRVFATAAGEFSIVPAPSASSEPTASGTDPDPSATGASSPSPSGGPSGSPAGSSSSSPSASPSPSPSPSPSSTPAPTPSPIAIVEARSMAIGASVRIRGTVTAEAGRLGSSALLAIADGTAGIVVRLPAGAVGPARGTEIELSGTLAAPYGQLEIRPVAGAIVVLGSGIAASPARVLSTDLGEAVEARLVSIDVVIDKAPHRETNGGITLDARDAATGGRLSIRADASSGIATADLPRDARATLTGIVGQRATRSGRLDGYRVWLRDRLDIAITTPPSGSPSPTGGSGGSARPTTSIAQALLSPGLDVRVAGTVTAAGKLLDSDGRIVVIQDATAAVAVRLPASTRTPRVGARVRVDGVMGRAYGAPRIAATAVADLGTGAPVLPLSLRTGPGAGYEWRLVRVDGVVADIHRSGDRWTAEIAVGSSRILVAGLPGAAIPPTALAEGRRATVVGIVRRPYPTATDRRFAIDPRSPGDVRLGGPASAGGPGGTGSGTGGLAGAGSGASGSSPSGPAAPVDVDIATLGEHVGATVRIGGIVTAIESGAILVDDGTAVGRVVLGGDAATYLDQLVPGDALDAVGRVRGGSGADGTLEVDVASAAGIARVGDPGVGADDPSSEPAIASAPGVNPARAGDPTRVADLTPEPATIPVLIVVGSLGAVGLTLLAGVALILRRARERRASDGRIALRLAAVAGAGPDPVAPA